MLRRLRRQLRTIRYHSASRPDTWWHRWRDRLLGMAALAAIPLMLLAENTMHRSAVTMQAIGSLTGPVGGPFTPAGSFELDEPRPWANGRPHAEFALRLEDRLDGWPLTSARSVAVPVLWFRPLSSEDGEDGARLGAVTADPEGYAIAAWLQSSSQPEVARVGEAWLEDGRFPRRVPTTAEVDAYARTGTPFDDTMFVTTQRERYWPGTVLAIGAWWLMASAAVVLGMGTLRGVLAVSHAVRDARGRARRAAGRCAECGYELRGTEWSASCPECGALAR